MEFDTNDALVRFLEDEGLSPFTLLKIAPKPTAAGRKLPTSVTMEWGLADLEHEGDRERFMAWRVTAEDVELFRSDGELDRFEECNVELGDASGIDLRLEAGGTLFLRCGRLVVSDDPVERLRKGRPRPHHGEFILELDAEPATWGAVRASLGLPPTLPCFGHLTGAVIAEGDRPREAKRVKLVDVAGHDLVWLSVEGQRLTLSRGKWAEDVMWNDLWSRVATAPGVTRIFSRDLICPPGIWPADPPPKPMPRVWPDVYGVTCDFALMTFGELRVLFGLSANCPFVFDEPGVPQPEAADMLGAAPRLGGRRMSGVFRDESAKPLVHVNADFHDSALSFRRAPGCDDATWRAVWRAPEGLPGVRERHSRTTRSPPDPWPAEPPVR
jgi:hypothetical protein